MLEGLWSSGWRWQREVKRACIYRGGETDGKVENSGERVRVRVRKEDEEEKGNGLAMEESWRQLPCGGTHPLKSFFHSIHE